MRIIVCISSFLLLINLLETVDMAFHPSEVDKMSTRNFWKLSGKKKLFPRSCSTPSIKRGHNVLKFFCMRVSSNESLSISQFYGPDRSLI